MDFYPSISEKLLTDAIEYASEFVKIDKKSIEVSIASLCCSVKKKHGQKVVQPIRRHLGVFRRHRGMQARRPIPASSSVWHPRQRGCRSLP